MSVRKSKTRKTLEKKKQEKPYLTLPIKETARHYITPPEYLERETRERRVRVQRKIKEIEVDPEIKIKLDLLKKNVRDAFDFFQQNISGWAEVANRDKVVMIVDNIIHNTKDRIPKKEMDKTYKKLEEEVYKKRREGIKKLVGIT